MTLFIIYHIILRGARYLNSYSQPGTINRCWSALCWPKLHLYGSLYFHCFIVSCTRSHDLISGHGHMSCYQMSNLAYLWTNPPHGINRQVTQCAFQNCRSPHFVISMSKNRSSNCYILLSTEASCKLQLAMHRAFCWRRFTCTIKVQPGALNC